MKKILEGVEEIGEGMDVLLTNEDPDCLGVTCVLASNECGYNCTIVPAQQLFDALKAEGYK